MTVKDTVIRFLPSEERVFNVNQPYVDFNVIPLVVKIATDTNIKSLKEAIYSTVKRHQAFNICYDAKSASKFYKKNFSLEIEEISFVELGSQAALTAFQKEAERLRWQINLAKGNLINACIFLFPDSEKILLLQIHHIICDAASAKILLKEIAQVYFNEQVELSLGWMDFSDYYLKKFRVKDPTFTRLKLSPHRKLGSFFSTEPSGMRFKDLLGINKIVENVLSERVTLKNLNTILHAAAMATMHSLTDGNAAYFLSNFNGRNAFPDINLKYSFGWFAQTNPILLNLENSAEDLLRASEHTLTLTDEHCWDWGAVRYSDTKPKIIFDMRLNFTGSGERFLVGKARDLFSVKADNIFSSYLNPGPKDHPENFVPYPMLINSFIKGQDFMFDFRYSAKHVSTATAKKIAESLAHQIKKLSAALL